MYVSSFSFSEKPVFTIGAAPVISDLDNFSEVSLDRDGNSEISSGPFYSNPLAELDSYANLQNLHDVPPTLDLNSNNCQHQQQHYDQNIDVNTNPITALGSAASMVFSTFSSIMKGSQSQSKFDESQNQSFSTTPRPSASSSTMPTSTGDEMNINSNVYGGNYGLPLAQPSDPNARPPTFFTPGEENLFKKTEVEQPSNTFRLGSNKKKTYAHIPGLSSSQQTQNVPQNFNLNPVMPPMPPQPVTHVDSMANFQPPAPLNQHQSQPQQNYQEVSPEKPSSNKFSFSSLLDKIPVTKNLFGSSNDDNSYQQQPSIEYNQQYGYQDFTVTSQNYFSPQQSNESQPPINFFNQQQPNYSFPSAQPSSVSDVQHTMTSAPLSTSTSTNTSYENVMPVNFFNPQQFNTMPFAPKVQQPENQAENLGQIQNAKIHEVTSDVPIANVQGTFIGIQQTPITTPGVIPPQTISPALQEPPKINTPVVPQQAVFQSNPNNVFDTPPTNSTGAESSISFFNPSEASELFKSRATDDGKPKNPYSNTRTRGVGLYKPRSSLTSESTSAQVILPPVPISSNNSTQMNAQQYFTALPTDDLSRPPSIPTPKSIEEQKQSTSPMIMPVENTQTNATINSHLTPSQPIYEIAQKKSDLNVPEMENVEQATTVSDTSNVSNFFGTETSTNKINEQISAINFFQATPEANQSVANFPPPQPLDSVNETKVQNPINFFSMGDEGKVEIQQSQPLEQQVRIIVMIFFYVTCIISFILLNIIKEQKQFEVKTEEFSLPAVTAQTSTLMNDTALMNELADKMESLSACSRSTLSLFATSELDSSAALKQTANLESLIPKYLETQDQREKTPELSHERPEILHERPALSLSPSMQNKGYRPVYCHWFYQSVYWHPFSMTDSMAIENAIAMGEELICTNGGRYEVNIKERRRASIYWPSGSNAIRKSSWFFMDTLTENRNLIPYEEALAECLEKEYEKSLNHSRWNHRIHLPELLPHQEYFIFKDATTMEHHKIGQILMVKRGLDEFDIVDGEEGTADHLIVCISNFGDKIDDNGESICTS